MFSTGLFISPSGISDPCGTVAGMVTPKGSMSTGGETLQVSVLLYRCSICWLLRAPDKRFSHTLDSLGRWPRPASSFRSAQAATLLEFHVYCMRECKDFKLVILLVLVYSWPACISFELTRFVLLRWQFSGLLHLARSWFCSYVSQKPAAYVCMVTDFGYWKVAILLGLIAHKGIKLFKFV